VSSLKIPNDAKDGFRFADTGRDVSGLKIPNDAKDEFITN